MCAWLEDDDAHVLQVGGHLRCTNMSLWIVASYSSFALRAK